MSNLDFGNLEQELKIRKYSPKTIKAYLYYNRECCQFLKKTPKFVTTQDIKDYLEHLVEKNLSESSINLAINALKSYYKTFWHRNLLLSIRRPRRRKSLPIVLSKNEVKRILESISNRKHKLILSLMYAAGLRVSEVVRLKVKDLDFENGVLIVRSGKGKKDRQTLLSEGLAEQLESLVGDKNSDDYVFESNRGGRLTERSIQKIFLNALKKSGIKKKATCHSLRHSFATHLLEQGVDIRYIQELLGHKRLETTQVYTKVTSAKLKGIKSPLENL